MKKDTFVSVGMVLHVRLSLDSVYALHSFLDERYNFFEIIILDMHGAMSPKWESLLQELQNIRIIKLAKEVDIEIAHSVLVENCIGDFMSIFDPNHDSLDDLSVMLEKSTNYDIVIGKRQKKFHSFFESLFSKIFYKAFSLLSGYQINEMYSDFFVINRRVINFITKNEDKVKYLKLLQFNNGFSICEHPYMPLGKKAKHRSFLSNINFAIDLLVHHSRRVIRAASILSLFAAMVNLLFIIYVFGVYFFKDNVVEGWASSNIYNSFMYFTLFLVLSILGEYIRTIMENQKQTPLYEITDDKSSTALFSNKRNVTEAEK